MAEQYDLIVIGSGPGGYVAAIRAAQLGMRTALVEKMDTLGGTCLNVGCIPSKAIIDSSKKYHDLITKFPEHGIATGRAKIKLDLSTLLARKDAVVKKLTGGVAGLVKGNKIKRYTGIGILKPNAEASGAGSPSDGSEGSASSGGSNSNTHRVDIYENPNSDWNSTAGAIGTATSAAGSATTPAAVAKNAVPARAASDNADTSDNAATTNSTSDNEVAQNATPIESIYASRVLLATGSVPTTLPFAQFDGKYVLSSTGALCFESVPETLAVVGAGAIGLEMAFVWASLGSKVTVIEKMPQILPNWDSQVARTLQRELKQLGIECILNAAIQSLTTPLSAPESSENTESGSKVHIGLENNTQILADKVLIATGRRAALDTAGISEAGIALSEDSQRIAVNENYETNIAGVYAIGDLIPGPMLAHKAEDEAVVAVERMNGIPAHLNYDAIPSVVYTAPEAASLGYSEDALKKEGRDYAKGVFNIAGNGRALAMGLQTGFVKILSDPVSDRILGAHIVAEEASNLVSEIVTVMEMRGSSEDIARIVHAHPTLTEAVKESALAVHGRSIHSLARK